MACRQILSCRRCCRLRPFLLVLVLAAYLFYQTLTPLRTRRHFSAVGSGVLPNKVAEVQHRRYKEVSARQPHCFLPSSNLQAQKEIEDYVFKYSRSQTQAVILYIPSSGSKQDLQLYRHILSQHSYRVTVLEDRTLNGHENPHPDELSTWDLLICLSSGTAGYEHCLNVVESQQTMSLQKANVLPQIQHLIYRTKGLCQIVRTFPDLQLPLALPACPESSALLDPLQAVKSHDNNGRTSFAQTLYQQTKTLQQPQTVTSVDHKEPFKIQDLSIIIKAYVLVTSLTPLRAFIHSSGVVSFPPRKKRFAVKLQTVFETFLRASSPQQTFDDMKEAISKLLLVTEVFSEAPSSGPKPCQCSSCFQMLTFDIGFSSLHPVVLEVHGHFDFQADEDTNFQDQSFKRTLLEDTFRILLSNLSSSSTFFEALQNVYRSAGIKDEYHQKESDHCLTLEELNPLISFVKELQNLGQFELLFPSAAPKVSFLLHDLYRMVNPERRLDSILNVHWLLSNLLEQLQVINKVAHTNLPGWRNKDSRNVSRIKARWSNLRTSYSAKQHTKVRASTTAEKHEGLHLLNQAKEIPCSHDKDTLLHVRQIFTSPDLGLHPEFDPKIKEYYTEVPFDVVTVQIRAEPMNCQCEVHLDEKKGPSAANYPLGLGINRINILITDESQSLHEILSIYKIIIYREDRPNMLLFDDFMDCGSLIHPEESCGLQPLSAEYLSTISKPQLRTCEMGDTKGQWIVPCLSCSDNRTCDWRQITWQPANCQYPILKKTELQQCVKNKKILFIGDSTNRGMMYYLIERVNDTLQEWQKAHDMKFYHNVNNRKTFISYSYYPQFWININQRPTFEEALELLLLRSQPLENTGQTILVVGGVQWLNFHHLHIIHNVLKRANLSNILVVIKSLGMGFHLPVDGVHSLSPAEVQNLWNENQAILNTAKQYGYEVVDTFIITMGRYKEFLQGKCGCHFHEVVKSKTSEGNSPMTMTLSRPYALGKYFNNQSNLMQLQAYLSNPQSPYHVRGPINQVYSEILLSRICANDRKAVGT
ncbi:cadherin-like and PC-esterase domain-containing protein 1 isoform X2 [Hemicordylus capensis]|uniref:cadherin-like and PC-esterase domain-containing protein 1 isoform X2 n=1 Tax=Hemicordylus capensis TaxID=884348 RepID=UPI0023033B1E|nr:cadherin-like and PC-esterase domain-containing protein 1 isoform X2 [Hemicordylus capensis]